MGENVCIPDLMD